MRNESCFDTAKRRNQHSMTVAKKKKLTPKNIRQAQEERHTYTSQCGLCCRPNSGCMHRLTASNSQKKVRGQGLLRHRTKNKLSKLRSHPKTLHEQYKTRLLAQQNNSRPDTISLRPNSRRQERRPHRYRARASDPSIRRRHVPKPEQNRNNRCKIEIRKHEENLSKAH